MLTRGPKNRRMEGQMNGQTLFYRNLPTTARFQKIGQIETNMVKEEFFLKKPATVDIEKTKHLQIITDPTTTRPSEAFHLAAYRDKIH